MACIKFFILIIPQEITVSKATSTYPQKKHNNKDISFVDTPQSNT
jgi:hypothetical protein